MAPAEGPRATGVPAYPSVVGCGCASWWPFLDRPGWQAAHRDVGTALRTFREGLRFATEGGRCSPNHECEAHIGIAQVLYARDELDDALRHATEAVTLGRQVVESFLLSLALDAKA